MTDDPSPDVTPGDELEPDQTTQRAEKKEPEVSPGLLPLGPPVFGKWAFFITAVPFLIYWGGTAFGSYLEKTRKLEPAHRMRATCRAMVAPLEEELKQLPAEQAAEVIARVDMSSVATALDDEAGKVEDITLQCQKLLSADFSDLPVEAQFQLTRFRNRVEHFLELQELVEHNDLNGIRESHNAFRLNEEPIGTMLELCRFLVDKADQELVGAAAEQGPIGQQTGLEDLAKALRQETTGIEDLKPPTDKLLAADLSTVPHPAAETLKQLQTYAGHLVTLLEAAKVGDMEKVRSSHMEFMHNEDPGAVDRELHRSWYPFNYSVACVVALIAVIVALPGFLKIPFRVSPLAVGVGIAGIVIWIGLWTLDKEVLGLAAMLSPNSRAAFNPLEELKADPAWMYTFLAIRLVGLVLVIPIAEEFFTRGFLMRYIEDIDWDQIPMGMATWRSVVGIIVYGAVAHPGEIVAAVAWFGLVTWLYLRTKNVWDCVIAHGLTNLLLAGYVLATGTWELW